MARVECIAHLKSAGAQTARRACAIDGLCEIGGHGERAGILRIERQSLAGSTDRGPIHEVPVRHVGDEASRGEVSLEPSDRALNRWEYLRNRGRVAGIGQMIARVENPLQRPVRDQEPVSRMIAGGEHLGQAVRPLALRRLA